MENMKKKEILLPFSKRRYLCLFTVLLLLGALPFQAAAFQTRLGEVDVTFDSTFSIGGSFRVEERDDDLVGKCNQPQYGINDPTTTMDDGPFLAEIADKTDGTPNGAWQPNMDDGNLNFDRGFFSQTVKGIHELDLRWRSYGFFTRANWFYDHYLMQESDDMRWDIMKNDDIKDNHGRDIDILDYFFYSTFDVGPFPMAFRLGFQVINWGEAALISHGMNVSNPLDAAKFRVPGAEVKDALVPQGSVYASIGLTNNLNFDAYYQYEWEETKPDSPGTYFSTNDIAGPGAKWLQLGYAQYADYQGNDMNTVSNVLFSRYWVVERDNDDKADDQGQFGLKFGWYAEFLNETEFNFYYSNYHSHTPMICMDKLSADSAKLQDAIVKSLSGQPTDYTLSPQYRLVYPEDIQLFGMSFNTLLPFGIACGGEVAYRKDEPYQIDTSEIVFKMLETISEAVPFISTYSGLSQIGTTWEDDVTYAQGEQIKGYVRLDSINWDINFTKMFFNMMGMEKIVVMTEIGVTKINNMPDPDKLRLETSGTDRSGNDKRAWEKDENGNLVDGSNFSKSLGVEGVQPQSDFADDLAWGYVMLIRGTFNDMFWGVNVSPLVVFRHDVDGTTPSSAGTFIQGRKKIDLKLGFDWRQNWSFDLGYTIFTGGDGSTGTANMLEDRDYVSFNLKYAI